ncbi:hypothetical protein AB1E18_000392 [Capra hircus]
MCPLLSWLALRAASFLLLKFGIIYWEWNHLPPGPFPFPILGNLWQLSFQLHPATLLQLAQTHGPMFTVRVGPTPLVVLCGFRAVKEALVSHSEPLPGWPLTPLFRDLVGERGKAALPAGDRLNDLFPWPFHCLPGPYQDMFRYQKVVRGYDHREISRHKLRTSEAPKDFISCYLAQIIKVGQRGLQRAGELPAEREQQELDAVLGTSGAICYKDHKLLPHTCAILHEVQHLSSVV